jgi:hypothetical protein
VRPWPTDWPVSGTPVGAHCRGQECRQEFPRSGRLHEARAWSQFKRFFRKEASLLVALGRALYLAVSTAGSDIRNTVENLPTLIGYPSQKHSKRVGNAF